MRLSLSFLAAAAASTLTLASPYKRCSNNGAYNIIHSGSGGDRFCRCVVEGPRVSPRVDSTVTTTVTKTSKKWITSTTKGPTITSTRTASTTVTSVSTSTSTTTSTSTAQSTSFSAGAEPPFTPKMVRDVEARDNEGCGEAPEGLSRYSPSEIYAACECYVHGRHAARAAAVTPAAAAPAELSVRTPADNSVVTVTKTKTIVQTWTRIVFHPPPTHTTTTITSTATVGSVTVTTTTAVATATQTVPGPVFNVHSTYSNACFPINYQEFRFPATNTFDETFQYCAQLCKDEVNSPGCVEIFVGYQSQNGGGGYTCMTGGGVDDKTWTASEFQCNLPSPPYSQFGVWYDVPAF